MARQLRIEYPGAFYHITSRGNERVLGRTKRDAQLAGIYVENRAVFSVLDRCF